MYVHNFQFEQLSHNVYDAQQRTFVFDVTEIITLIFFVKVFVTQRRKSE